MKRRMMSLLAAAMMLTTAIVPASYAFAEEDLVLSVPGNEQVMDKTDEESVLDEMNSANESILGALGKKDWEALAKSVEKTGDWREDLVAIAQSQVGYTEESDGTTIYADWAGYENGANWTALFVNWVANKAGLTTKQFPSGDSYASLVNAMRKVNAVKTISRSNYPVSGDLALIKANGQELVAFVVYVSNGYASVIHGDDQGAVTRVTYRVSSSNFSTYIDLNELLERAGVEVGKGGKVPAIPAEGIAAWTNTNAVYMRSEASTASKRVTTLKRSNTAVLVTGAEMGEDGYIWYAVKYSRYTGYIRSDLLKLDQEALSAAQPTAVPTATPTAAPTAEPTAVPVVTPAATVVPAATPVPTEVPHCILCAEKSEYWGVKLPETGCVYESLAALTAAEASDLLNQLDWNDYAAYRMYLECHAAHVQGGAQAVICSAEVCDAGVWTQPGAAHVDGCPWYSENTLDIQERVVNVTVMQNTEGEGVAIHFDLTGALRYDWYCVGAGANGADALKQTGASYNDQTYIATESGTYYCIATLEGNFTVRSKNTVVDITAATPVTSQAIIGEEITFKYYYEGAVSYAWMVKATDGAAGTAVSGAAYTGANTEQLVFQATAEDHGKQYYCVATLADQTTVTSTCYTLDIVTDDLCKYVDELAAMTKDERVTMMTQVWDAALAQNVLTHWQAGDEHCKHYTDLYCTCGENTVAGTHQNTCPWWDGTEPEEDLTIFMDCTAFPTECAMIQSWLENNASPMEIYNDMLTLKGTSGQTSSGEDYDRYFAVLMHSAAHEAVQTLLCDCEAGMYPELLAPGATHGTECAWYIAGVDGEQLASRIENETGFAAWAETATPAMIARALKAQTLDHLVLDGNELYVAREENPRATVDENGYVKDILSGLVIAQIINGVFTPVSQIQ